MAPRCRVVVNQVEKCIIRIQGICCDLVPDLHLSIAKSGFLARAPGRKPLGKRLRKEVLDLGASFCHPMMDFLRTAPPPLNWQVYQV